MLKSLYARLSLTLTGVLLTVGLLFVIITIVSTRSHLEVVAQELNRDLAENLINDHQLIRGGQLDEAALKQTFHHYMSINPSIEIYLVDETGGLLAYSAEPGKVKRQRVDLLPVKRFLANDYESPLLGDDPRDRIGHKIFSAAMLPLPDGARGYLYVILRSEAFDSIDELVQQSLFLRISGWSIVVSLSFGLIVGMLLFRLLTRRLQRLGDMLEEFRESGFDAPLASQRVLSNDNEVDRLEIAFECMAARIAEQIQQLKEKDRSRRDMVAQVSHDLRTPLSALHGYLETLRMKENQLSAGARSEYLAIALQQSERLRRLVDDLFQLAKLEAQDVRPAIEPVSIADLIQDVVQKYRLMAERNGIKLILGKESTVPFVLADVALIERVLENLIDNAIEHTPPQGEIVVSARLAGRDVDVEIRDTGEGIERRDLPLIFDRFFRGAAADKQKPHAGLGLAIARRILDLHNGRFEVHSQVSVGTAVLFSLPVWRADR